MKVVDSTPRVDPEKAAREGILELGAYVPGKPIQDVKREYGLTEVIKLASNECPLPLPPSVFEAISREFESLCRYPDGHCRKLRARVAEFTQIAPESLLFGNGAEECLRLIAQAFLNSGETGLVPTPVYDAYDTATRLPGARVVKIPLRDYCIDLEATLARVDRHTKIIWLCSPLNPTGTLIRRRELNRWLQRLPDGVLVVLDEAYREYVSTPEAARAEDYLGSDARVIGLRTFSKAFGLAGLRVGYIVAHPRLIEIISMVKLPFNVNQLAQAAALCMLDEKDFVRQHMALIRTERDFLIKAFEARDIFVVTSETNFLFAQMPVDSDILFRQLLPQGLIIRPGSIFGMPRFIRLTVGTREQNQRFLAALDHTLAKLQSGDPSAAARE